MVIIYIMPDNNSICNVDDMPFQGYIYRNVYMYAICVIIMDIYK